MARSSAPRLRLLAPADRACVDAFVAARWGSEVVAVHDEVIRPSDLAGFVALDREAWAGLVRAVERARRAKPQIPLLGEGGVPIRDEVELERSLP